MQIPDDQIIRMTENTSYEKVSWNLRIINNNPKKLTNSSIFIGPSWLQGGINDSLLNSYGYKSINMGVNHGGADLDYYFVNRIIRFKPKYIFLHRFPNGQGVFHPMMPLLISPIDYSIIFKNTSINFVFKFISKRFYFVLKYLFNKYIYYKQTYSYRTKKQNQFGWRPEGFSHITLGENEKNNYLGEMISLNQRMKLEKFDKNGVLILKNGSIKNFWRQIYSKFYFGNGELAREKTILLCDKYKIQVAEIYIPHFSDSYYDEKFDSNQYFFRSHRKLKPCYYLKNVGFLSKENYWFDLEHLNSNGSCLFTDSLYKILPK